MNLLLLSAIICSQGSTVVTLPLSARPGYAPAFFNTTIISRYAQILAVWWCGCLLLFGILAVSQVDNAGIILGIMGTAWNQWSTL